LIELKQNPRFDKLTNYIMLRYKVLTNTLRNLHQTKPNQGNLGRAWGVGEMKTTAQNTLIEMARKAKLEREEGRVDVKDMPRVYTTKEVALDGSESIAVLHMNYSEKMNSIDMTFLTDFEEELTKISTKDTKCMILKSDVPHVFNLGLDLKERELLKQRQVGPFVARIRSLINTIRSRQMPTIAAIDGYCIGTGMEIALACDFRVAASHSQLQLNDIELMLNGGIGTIPTLYQICGEADTKRILFGSGNYTGEEALEYRMINESIAPRKGEPDHIIDLTLEYARNITASSKLEANALHKACINEGLNPFDESADRLEREWLRQWRDASK